MRVSLYSFILALIASWFIQAHGAVYNGEVVNDTVVVYTTWEDLIYDEPAATLVGDLVYNTTNTGIIIYTDNDTINSLIANEVLAVRINAEESFDDWYINSAYLNTVMESDYEYFEDFVPLYFNEKTAFVRYWGDKPEVGTVYLMKDGIDEFVPMTGLVHNLPLYLYWLDLENSKIVRITHKTLPDILYSYPDLMHRYKGMKDYKKDYVIDFFLNLWNERRARDPEVLNLAGEVVF